MLEAHKAFLWCSAWSGSGLHTEKNKEMEDRTASLLCLLVVGSRVSASAELKTVTAKPGQNVTLPCTVDKIKPDIVVEWNRTDLMFGQYVLLFRNAQYFRDKQYEPFIDRVELKDVSLVLKNVSVNDNGTYEVRVDYPNRNSRKKRSNLNTDPICIITLIVTNPEPPGGQTDDQVIKNGLIAGLTVAGVLLLGFAGFVFWIFKISTNHLSQRSLQPAADEGVAMQDLLH